MDNEAIENFPNAKSGVKESVRRQQSAMVRVMRAGSEDIVVGENSSLEGSFETQGSMFVDGKLFHADLKTSLLSIGSAGSVEGTAFVSRAEIAGSFDGQLVVSGEVILRSTSRVAGEIQCGKLISHRGAVISAQVTVVEDEPENSEIGEETRSFRPLNWHRPFSRRFVRHFSAFSYGVFFTLGMIGLILMISRS